MKTLIKLLTLFIGTSIFAQAGHLMQGVGTVNMSMGGAATAQPLDISGAIQWNPATLSSFYHNTLNVDLGAFFASPELSSKLPANMMMPGSPAISGTTKNEKGISPMPSIAYVWAKPDSKHTFGVSVFGVSGFGVDFPTETNLPMDMNENMNPNWNPNDSNPISYPQNMGGFGHIKSNYMMMQVGLSWAYKITDKFSIGLQPNIDYSKLEIAPNPTSSPSMTAGYPEATAASAIGYGGQVGLFFDTKNGLKLGVAYKSKQYMQEFKFENTYLDDSDAPSNTFTMNYPAVLSIGFGYSKGDFDFATDFRYVYYENTEGFEKTGWSQTASVTGFGWRDMQIFSAGLQYKGIKKLPLRIGFTHSTNPINEEVAFYSVSAPAVIKNAVQFGLGFNASEKLKINAMYHHGSSCGDTKGNLLNPMMASSSNPYGAIPGTEVSYNMKTDLIMIGVSYSFSK
jgi:long-chain fatty acid transport protein